MHIKLNPASFTDLKLVYSNGWVFDLATTGTVPRPPNNVYIQYSGPLPNVMTPIHVLM